VNLKIPSIADAIAIIKKEFINKAPSPLSLRMISNKCSRRKFLHNSALATASLALPLSACSKQSSQSIVLPLQTSEVIL